MCDVITLNKTQKVKDKVHKSLICSENIFWTNIFRMYSWIYSENENEVAKREEYKSSHILFVFAKENYFKSSHFVFVFTEQMACSVATTGV